MTFFDLTIRQIPNKTAPVVDQMTMGSTISRATSPTPDQATVPAAAAAVIEREREANGRAVGDGSAVEQPAAVAVAPSAPEGGHSTVPGQDTPLAVSANKRKAEVLLANDAENDQGSAHDDLAAAAEPAKRAKREHTGLAEPVPAPVVSISGAGLDSIFGGPISQDPPRPIGPFARGQKRGAEDDDDDDKEAVGQQSKRARLALPDQPADTVDEEITRTDVPTSLGDVLRAAATQAKRVIMKFRPPPPGEFVPTGSTNFLSLPLELRFMVYTHSLKLYTKPIRPRMPNSKRKPHVGFPIRRVISLLLSHRLIHKEALAFMMSHNTYRLSLTHHRTWFNLIGRQATMHLRHVILECDGRNKHAWGNLINMQNTMKKRCDPHQLRTIEYELHWSMIARRAVHFFAERDMRNSWVGFKRLEKVTIVGGGRAMENKERLKLEKRDRVLSRVCLESGTTVVGSVKREWRRDKKSRPWVVVKLKEGWEFFVRKDKRKNSADKGKMSVDDDMWDEVVTMELLPDEDDERPFGLWGDDD